MTREEKFKKAQEARKRAASERRGFGPSIVPDFQYLVLKQDKVSIFRLVGNSLETREIPSDCLRVERSLIKADDDSWFTCIWDQDPNWPLRVLMRKLAKYTWNKEKKQREYENEGDALLTRFKTNNELDNPYSSGMFPDKFVLINAIDRMDSWCKDNKHTKLMAWNETEKEGKTFHTAGVKNGFYNHIFDLKCNECNKHFEDVDFVVKKFSKNKRPDQNTNYLVYWHENKTVIETMEKQDKEQYFNKIVIGDLTEEEKNYVRYDLENIPFISKTTPAGVILSKLGKFIKDVDTKYGTNVYSQFVELKEKELEEQQNSKNEEDKETFVSASVENVEQEEVEQDLPTEVERPVEHTKVKVKEPKLTLTQEACTLWPGLVEIKDNPKELSLIKSIDIDNQEIQYNCFENDLEDCPDCGMRLHPESMICPGCAAHFS
jgi:hypothetical protein